MLEPFRAARVVGFGGGAEGRRRMDRMDLENGTDFETWSLPGWILVIVLILSAAVLSAILFGGEVCGALC